MIPKVDTASIPKVETSSQVRKTAAWHLHSGDQRILLLVGDLLSASLAMLVALFMWAQGDWLKFTPEFFMERVQPWFYLLIPLWLILMVELYDVHRSHRSMETLRGVGMAALVGLGLYLLVYFISNNRGDVDALPRLGVAGFFLAATALTLGWRFTYIAIFTAPQLMRRALVVGAGRSGQALIDVINHISPPPFQLLGLIDDDPEKADHVIGGYPVLGNHSTLLEIIHRENISDLIFAISGQMLPPMFQAVLDAREKGVEVATMPMVYEEVLNRVPIYLLESDWLLRSFIDQARAGGFYEFSKRLLDVLGGLVGLIILAVTFPLIAISILLESGSPIFFYQNRVGKSGQPYRIIKFRTMHQNSENDGSVRVTTENDPRITRVGLLLRKSHIDELPQFINVLKGEMSLIGPRAERSELVDRLQQQIPFYRARLLVKPGITGWAQVNFGYAASVEDSAIKLEYDLYYIKHRNLMLDLVILLRTFGTVIGFRGQ